MGEPTSIYDSLHTHELYELRVLNELSGHVIQ